MARTIDKLGYKGPETAELFLEDARVPKDNLLGGQEGRGFQQMISGLEIGRINVASRATGVAQAAFDAAIVYAQQRETMGKRIADHQAIQLKLADMATKIRAARLLTRDAARKKDSGQRSDLDVGMAKLFATEVALECSLESMRVHGGVGYTTELPVERYYRDAPLMAVAEGTNEIQRIVIARRPAGVVRGRLRRDRRNLQKQSSLEERDADEGDVWSLPGRVQGGRGDRALAGADGDRSR